MSDHINLPLSEHGRDYVNALLAAAIVRATMPKLYPNEVNAVLTVLPDRAVNADVQPKR
jgi:hypothetical protein